MNKAKWDKWVRKHIWPIEITIQDIWVDLKYKWETRNDCLDCDGAGQSLEDVVDGYYRIYSTCGWCDGSGEMNILRRLEWRWIMKYRPALVNLLLRIVPKNIQIAYEKRRDAKYEKAWREEYQAMKGECDDTSTVAKDH